MDHPCTNCRRPVSAASGKCPHCGHLEPTAASVPVPSPAAPDAPLPGRVGQYRVVRELGRGGMGRVLEAVDEPLGRRVAVKVLLTAAQQDASRRRRFVEEARITGGLEHPGIAPVYNLGRNPDGSEFFSMKLVAGRDLGDILKACERGERDVLHQYPLPRLLSIFERVVETVAYAHARHILHRDLKPANIMIGTHGEVWVLDWGLAKVLGKSEESTQTGAAAVTAAPGANPELTVPGQFVGTPQYMAPEQARSQPLDQRTDIFGLGGILYRMLTGLSPNQGPDYMGTLMNAALAEWTPVRSTPRGRHAPTALAAIAEKCLAAQPNDRYGSANDLLTDLRAYAAGEAIVARPDGLVGKLLRFARRHRRAAVVFASAFLLLLVGSTVAATIIAALDRRALDAERGARAMQEKAQEAERARQQAVDESAARARRRLQAFTPYAEATDLLMRGQAADRAVRLLDDALKIDPAFPEAQFALGEAQRLNGNPALAAQAYLRANELSKQYTGRPHVQALLSAGMTFDGAGDYDRSEQAFLQAEREGADHPLALVGKAFRLAHERKLKDARTAAEQALAKAPHFWETHFAFGFVLNELTEDGVVAPEPTRSQGIASMRKALELSPRQAEARVWLARALAHSGTVEGQAEALRLLDQAVALEPRNGNRYFARGVVRLNRGDPKGAEADLTKARELSAARGLLQHAEALAAYQRRDFERAYRALSELVQENRTWPPHMANWLALGFQLRRDQEIRPRFEEWCRQNPDFHAVYALRGQLKARDNDFPGAVTEDLAGLKVAPYNRVLRSQLALHQLLARRWNEALAAADAALELTPNDFSPQLTRARALAALGRTDDAVAQFNKLQKDYPTRAKEIDAARKELKAS
ncbi:MAG: protein kinase [Planctomycetia bacterium]|nr:protein kinase [Planctomycetia bacterium]